MLSTHLFRHPSRGKGRSDLAAVIKVTLISVFLIAISLIPVFSYPPAIAQAEASNNSTQALKDLDIGDLVVDHSWEWHFRSGTAYSAHEDDETAPVTWIVVAKNQYGSESGVTLLAEQPIGRYAFNDNGSSNSQDSSNHWGESSLRSWLNSSDPYSGEGFYHAFSETFKNNIVTVTVPNSTADAASSIPASELEVKIDTIVPGVYNVSITNEMAGKKLKNISTDSIITLTIPGKDNIDLQYNEIQDSFFKPSVQGYAVEEIENAMVETGEHGTYSTQDRVFVPSSTELGAPNNDLGPNTGTVFTFFSGANDTARRVSYYEEDTWYWTRSPRTGQTDQLITVGADGSFETHKAQLAEGAVRPLVNLSSTVPVSKKSNDDGVFEIKPEADPDDPRFTIKLEVKPEGSGHVEGAGSYAQDELVTVSAEAAEGYTFIAWMEDDSTVSLLTEYSFTVDGNRSLVATFQQKKDPADPDEKVRGDINGDGVVNILDVLMVMRHALDLENLTPEQEELADLNDDGIINVNDVLIIIKIALNLD